MKINNDFTIENGSVVSGSITVEHTVSVTNKETKTSRSTKMKTTLDFSGLSIARLVQYAAETIVIRLAGKFRSLGADYLQKHPEQVINIAETFTGERVIKSKEQTAAEFFAGLSNDEKKRFKENPAKFMQELIEKYSK